MPACRGHFIDGDKEVVGKKNADLSVTSEELTSLVLPLNVCLNKPFEDRIHERWSLWVANEEQDLMLKMLYSLQSKQTLCLHFKIFYL